MTVIADGETERVVSPFLPWPVPLAPGGVSSSPSQTHCPSSSTRGDLDLEVYTPGLPGGLALADLGQQEGGRRARPRYFPGPSSTLLPPSPPGSPESGDATSPP